jgi:hypothetical protein
MYGHRGRRAHLASACDLPALFFLIEVVIDSVDVHGALAEMEPDFFKHTRGELPDPRSGRSASDTALARFDTPEISDDFSAYGPKG